MESMGLSAQRRTLGRAYSLLAMHMYMLKHGVLEYRGTRVLYVPAVPVQKRPLTV